jgi:hypothetical protein
MLPVRVRPPAQENRQMNRRLVRRLALFASLAALGILAFAAVASAGEIKLACAGKGPRNKDSAGVVLCAAAPGKARTISGTIRDDAGKPVAAKVLVFFVTWTPAGGGSFSLETTSTKTISANAAGKFTLPVKVATRLNVKFEAVADEKLGISGGFAEAEVARRLDVRLKKLGGGRIKFTVKGASSVKVYVLDSSGYELSGVKPKRTSKAGVAIFNLSGMHGEFSYYVDVGALADLYWEDPRHTFRL